MNALIADMDIDVTKIQRNELAYFIKQLEELTGFDFSQYSESSLKRRIERLLQIWNIKTVADLLIAIKSDSILLQNISDEITVNTTEMFRDVEMWLELKAHVKKLHAVNPEIGLRIWHTACSRGDEVFSMLILLNELNIIDSAKLIATDISKKVLAEAALGKLHHTNYEYNKTNFEKVFIGKDFSTYFTSFDGTYYYFDKKLLEQVKFKFHNLDKDESLGLFDIVICRNVLIYFNMQLQDKVLNKLYDSIKTYGLLIIGSKETISWSVVSKKVETLDAMNKIYKKMYLI